jgi:hypothetical protein
MQRRYLTRFELYAFGRRLRLDGRTSDWIVALGSRAHRIVPARWRGTHHERTLRDRLVTWFEKLDGADPTTLERSIKTLRRLFELAESGRLRSIKHDELGELLGDIVAPDGIAAPPERDAAPSHQDSI